MKDGPNVQWLTDLVSLVRLLTTWLILAMTELLSSRVLALLSDPTSVIDPECLLLTVLSVCRMLAGGLLLWLRARGRVVVRTLSVVFAEATTALTFLGMMMLLRMAVLNKSCVTLPMRLYDRPRMVHRLRSVVLCRCLSLIMK